MLVGNKSDLRHLRSVETDVAKSFSEKESARNETLHPLPNPHHFPPLPHTSSSGKPLPEHPPASPP